MIGLEIYNGSGKTVFSSPSITTTYFLGSSVAKGRTGSITDDRIAGRHVWISVSNVDSDNTIIPRFSVSGNKISWDTIFGNFSSANKSHVVGSVSFSYGVY